MLREESKRACPTEVPGLSYCMLIAGVEAQLQLQGRCRIAAMSVKKQGRSIQGCALAPSWRQVPSDPRASGTPGCARRMKTRDGDEPKATSPAYFGSPRAMALNMNLVRVLSHAMVRKTSHEAASAQTVGTRSGFLGSV